MALSGANYLNVASLRSRKTYFNIKIDRIDLYVSHLHRKVDRFICKGGQIRLYVACLHLNGMHVLT